MSTFLTIVLIVFGSTINADEVKNLGRSSRIEPTIIAKSATAHVVNHEFCYSCHPEDEKEMKDTLEEVHTYAELKRDPRADLPSSFTICSNVMTTYGSEQTFFTLLGKDGNKWLTPFLMVADRTSFSYVKWAGVKLPPVFAHQCGWGAVLQSTQSPGFFNGWSMELLWRMPLSLK